jgi:hypothetical protein
MDLSDKALMDGMQFIFDPITKTAMIIRFDTAIAVPGRFNTYGEAHAACLRVLRASYADAYTHV